MVSGVHPRQQPPILAHRHAPASDGTVNSFASAVAPLALPPDSFLGRQAKMGVVYQSHALRN